MAMGHLEVSSLPVTEQALSEIGRYLAGARFQIVRDSNVVIDWRLGVVCHPLTAAMGIPGDRNVGAMRLQGSVEKDIDISKPTDLILIKSYGDGESKVRDTSTMEEVPIPQGSCVLVEKHVVLVVPQGVTIDFIFISESL
jgi:hypothetical protein